AADGAVVGRLPEVVVHAAVGLAVTVVVTRGELAARPSEVAGALPLQTGGEVRTAAGESEQGRAVLPVLPQPPVIENADVGLAAPVEVSRLDLAPGPGEASGGSPGGLDLAEVRTRAVQREDLRAVLAVGARARVVEHGHVVLAVTVVVTGSGCTHVPAEAAGTLPL